MRAIQKRITFALYCMVHRMPLSVQKWWQLRYARRIVLHAHTHVHLYRTLLQSAGISPEIRSFKDVEKLPVMNKQMFMGKMVEDYTDLSRRAHAEWYTTSGSSGEPFRFLRSELSLGEPYIDIGTYRFLWWQGKPLRSIFSPRVARIKMRGSEHSDRLLMQVEEFLTDQPKALAKIRDFRPEILSAYPSILSEIAELVEKKPELSPGARFTVSFGENLSSRTRGLIERTLKTEIYDRYGLEEIGAIGVECARHDGFHINTEAIIVEILDERDVPTKEGETGRIVATDLFNYNMPFIRYDTGDRGRISYGQCSCGVPSPRLWVAGRDTGSLRFGRQIHHLEFDGAMDGFMNSIKRYQIAKRSGSELVARIIPGSSFNDGIAGKIKDRLLKLVGNNVDVRIEVVQTLPITPRGKSRIVVDETNN